MVSHSASVDGPVPSPMWRGIEGEEDDLVVDSGNIVRERLSWLMVVGLTKRSPLARNERVSSARARRLEPLPSLVIPSLPTLISCVYSG